jgi:hypothetical protein
MTDSVLAKYTGRKLEDPAHTDAGESESLDDLGHFGYLRGTRDRALMLELRKKDGSVRSFGYAWLEEADFDPSEGITLHIAGRKITIRGRHLNSEIRPNVRLYQGIIRHRISWVQEADNATSMESGGKGLIIEKIEW